MAAALLLVLALCRSAAAQSVIVDHTSLPLFQRIPETYKQSAQGLSMVFVDRSVGSNINDGLTCMAQPYEQARTACKRYLHIVPQFKNPPEPWPGVWPRPNWFFFGWPRSNIAPELPCGLGASSWTEKLRCFERYVDRNATHDVYGMMPSYLEVENANVAPAYLASTAALRARHPASTFILYTANLARSTGTASASAFNAQVRASVQAGGGYLLDVADLESHDPRGNPCYDNRDGVPYTAGNARENYPDDGRSEPAICPHYTRESEGGHLGNPDIGKIRIAKAYWVLMAYRAGWKP